MLALPYPPCLLIVYISFVMIVFVAWANKLMDDNNDRRFGEEEEEEAKYRSVLSNVY